MKCGEKEPCEAGMRARVVYLRANIPTAAFPRGPTPRVLGRQLSPPLPGWASGQQLVVKGTGVRGPKAPEPHVLIYSTL